MIKTPAATPCTTKVPSMPDIAVLTPYGVVIFTVAPGSGISDAASSTIAPTVPVGLPLSTPTLLQAESATQHHPNQANFVMSSSFLNFRLKARPLHAAA